MGMDFVGFSFDGVHSSYLGLKRVSDGQFYTEQLQPTFENKTKTIPGRDGQFYFGSDYTEKEFHIKIAFDSVTEKQFRQITALFSTKKICNLIFDERPYKMYKVRLTAPIELSYVCFDEPRKNIGEVRDGVRVIKREVVPVEEGSEETRIEITREPVYPYVYEYRDDKIVTERIYKGEGEISLTCLSPMAQAPFKTLDAYTTPRLSYDVLTEAVDTNFATSYNNVDKWKETSGILTRQVYLDNNIDTPTAPPVDSEYTNINIWINTYNPGDIDSPFMLYLPYNKLGYNQPGTFSGSTQNTDAIIYINGFKTMKIAPFTALARYAEENGVIINSENHLIEGVRYNIDSHTWSKTGNLYNNYIIAGDFSSIIKQDILQLVTNEMELNKQIICINYNADPEDVWIKYNYFYY